MAEEMFVRTGLRIGQSATSTAASSTPSLTVDGRAVFSSNVGVGTSTPWGKVSILPSGVGTDPSFYIGSSTTHFIVTNAGNVGIGTTTPGSLFSINASANFYASATSTIYNGLDTPYLNVTGTAATSTFARGIDLAGGCFSISGSCLIAGDSLPSGTAGQTLSYVGTTLTATSSMYLSANGNFGIGSNASTTGRLTISSAGLAQTWAQVGNTLSLSHVYPTIATLSPNSVAFVSGSGSLRKYVFDGASWTQQGSALAITISNQVVGIAALSPSRIAYLDANNDSLRVYEFGVSSWSQIGSGLTVSSIGQTPSLAALAPNRIALLDNDTGVVQAYEFNGSVWSSIGSSITPSGSFSQGAIAALNSNRIAYTDRTLDSLSTYEFNGTTWTKVGSSLALTAYHAAFPALAAMSPNRVAFFHSDHDLLTVYEFNGSTWSQVGSSLTISGIEDTPALAALSPNRVAFIDDFNDSLSTYQFSSPLLHIGNSADYPYLTVSDAGYTMAEEMFVRTGLRIGQSATSTAASSTPSLTVDGRAVFSSNVGIGTSTPWGRLSILPSGVDTSPSFYIGSSTTHLIVTNAGNVGIAMTDPSVALDVTGDIEYTGTITDVSDERLKENISSLGSSLSKILQLNPVSFNMIGASTTQLGFLAQNVQQYFPNTISIVDPENGYLGLDYTQLIAPAIGAIQELDAKFDALVATTSVAEIVNATTTPREEFATTTPWYAAFADASDGLKSALEGLGGMVVRAYNSAIYAVAGIFDSVYARIFTTDELVFKRGTGDELTVKKLCLEDVCVTREEFKALLDKNGTQSAQSAAAAASGGGSSPVPAPAPEPVPEPTPAPESPPAEEPAGDTPSETPDSPA